MNAAELERIRNILVVLDDMLFDDNWLLIDNGLVKWGELPITTKGYDFIELTRSAERWEKVKNTAKSLEEAVVLADRYAREDLGLL